MFNSLAFKFWWRRLSVSSPRVKIKTQLPWPVRLLLMAAMLGVAGAIAMWTYDLGRGLAGITSDNTAQKLRQYKQDLQQMSDERDQLSTTVNAAESQLNIEIATKKQLAGQVKTLETENIRLKEDLAFFESLLPNATGGQGVAIRRLKVDLIAPNQVRYRLLIMQGGKGDREFVGNLQLTMSTVQGGKSAMMVFPDSNLLEADKFKLAFKHYQRVEGVLNLPYDATIKTVQARVLEKGQLRAQQSANL